MSDLKAGPELDALVAEKVMGRVSDHAVYPLMGSGEGCSVCGRTSLREVGARLTGGCARPYSTKISAAWEVVEKSDILDRGCLGDDDTGWYVRDCSDRYLVTGALTAPLAICLAALKAVRYEGER